MRTHLKRLTVLCAGAALLACANVGQRLPAAPAVAADEAYLIGRTAHLAGRYAEALSSYQSALLADPEHVNARNGLATLHAEQGALQQAIPLWRTLTAAAKGPESAFLFSNLGYAHLLNGDYDSALAALEQACLLDPLSHRSWQHLGKALDKVGQHERAELMYRQAAALQAHDFKADYAALGRPAIPAIDKAAQAGGERRDEWAATELRQGANGVYELHRLGPVKAPPLPAPEPASLAMLEIRNGNGVRGMAKSLSRKMDGNSLRVVKLSNVKGFKVLQTRVEYQPAFRDAARRLAGRFEHASVVEISGARTADLRLVIGRDLARGKFALRPAGSAAPVSFVEHQAPAKPARDNGPVQTTSGAQP
jgi:Flp pilus assembly protein TadD